MTVKHPVRSSVVGAVGLSTSRNRTSNRVPSGIAGTANVKCVAPSPSASVTRLARFEVDKGRGRIETVTERLFPGIELVRALTDAVIAERPSQLRGALNEERRVRRGCVDGDHDFRRKADRGCRRRNVHDPGALSVTAIRAWPWVPAATTGPAAMAVTVSAVSKTRRLFIGSSSGA